MNKQIAKQMLIGNVNACYNAVKENGWQSEMLKESIDNIFDEIELDHPKVKLPREVGEELDEWMFDNKDRLVGRIGELIFDTMTHDPKLINVFDFVGDSEENYFKVIDAYRYGWEAEPEAKWYVKTPESWESEDGDFGWLYKSIYGGVDTTSHGGEENEQFTRAEIKKYHLDSDIFTKIKCDEND